MATAVDRATQSSKAKQIEALRLEEALFDYNNWLKYQAVPLWLTASKTQHGIFTEQLLPNGQANSRQTISLETQLKQIVVLAIAHSRGWIDATSHITEVSRFLNHYGVIKRRTSATDAGVYASKISLGDGGHSSQRQYLSNLILQLFSYTCCHHAFGGKHHEELAESIFQRIERELGDFQGGWKESAEPLKYRYQRSHKGMLGTFLAAFQTTGNLEWMERAEKLFHMFLVHFYDQKRDLVPEYFNQDWSQVTSNAQVVKPGRLFEWVWVLRQYQTVSGVNVGDMCDRLYNKALHLGLNNHSLMFHSVSLDGEVLNNNTDLWTITQWIKASLAQATYSDGTDKTDHVENALTAMASLKRFFLSHPIAGQYYDLVDQNGFSISRTSRTRGLYHLMICGMECRRYLQSDNHLFGHESLDSNETIDYAC